MKEKYLNSGEMYYTGYCYEEFEGLLGSFYLTTFPLKSGNEQDKTDFASITGILNGFAQRHYVQKPEEAITAPRPTKEFWGQPSPIRACSTLIDLMDSISQDFGVGIKMGTKDMKEKTKLEHTILSVLDRHHVISLRFDEIDGVRVTTTKYYENLIKIQKPLFWCIQVR